MAERVNPGLFKIEGYLEEENERLVKEYPIITQLRDLETNKGEHVLGRVTGSFLVGSRFMGVSGVPFAGKSSVLKEFREYIRREIDPYLDFSREWSYEDALYAEVEKRGVKLQDIDYKNEAAVKDLLGPVNQHLHDGLIEELKEASRENGENRRKMAAWSARRNYPMPEENIQVVTSEIVGVGPSWMDMGRTTLHQLAEQDIKATMVIMVPDLLIFSKTIDIRAEVVGALPTEVLRILKERGIEPVGFKEELSDEEKGGIIQQIMRQSADKEFATFVQREMLKDYSHTPFGRRKSEENINLLNKLKLPGFLNLYLMDSLRFRVNYYEALKLKESLEEADREKHGEPIHEIILAFNPWVSGVYFRPPSSIS